MGLLDITPTYQQPNIINVRELYGLYFSYNAISKKYETSRTMRIHPNFGDELNAKYYDYNFYINVDIIIGCDNFGSDKPSKIIVKLINFHYFKSGSRFCYGLITKKKGYEDINISVTNAEEIKRFISHNVLGEMLDELIKDNKISVVL